MMIKIPPELRPRIDPKTLDPAGKVVKKAIGLRYLGDVLHQKRLDKQGTLVQRLVKKTQDGTLGKETKEPVNEVDEMGDIRIGDSENYHYHLGQESSTKKSALPLVLGLVTLLAGGGIGAGAFALLQGTNREPPPPAVQPAPTEDTDTLYDIGFAP